VLRESLGFDIHVQNYHEHGVGAGEDATAVSYVQLRVGTDRAVYGVGLDSNIVTATLKAVVSAVNRGIGQGMLALPAKQSAARTKVAV
jgi:2-isopropylmalate synthase